MSIFPPQMSPSCCQLFSGKAKMEDASLPFFDHLLCSLPYLRLDAASADRAQGGPVRLDQIFCTDRSRSEAHPTHQRGERHLLLLLEGIHNL